MINSEPSLEEIEDFNGRGSDEKKRTVNLVILGCLFVGALYTIAKVNFNTVSDELVIVDRAVVKVD